MAEPSARILVVEDDGELLEVLQYVFEDAGYQVAAASNGEEALRLAGSEQIDLVVLDIGMEGMSGLDVARRLRAEDDTRHLPIALHTGVSESAVRNDFQDYDLFLAKGDDAQRLLDVIKAFLAGRRST